MRLLQFTTAASSERRLGAVVGDGSTTTTTTSTSGGGGGGGAGGSAGAAASTAATSGTTPTHVLDLTAALKALDTVPELSLAQGMRGLLSFGDGAGLAAAQEAVKVNATEFRLKYSDITVVAPIYDPEKIVCVGMNYVDHCTGSARGGLIVACCCCHSCIHCMHPEEYVLTYHMYHVHHRAKCSHSQGATAVQQVPQHHHWTRRGHCKAQGHFQARL